LDRETVLSEDHIELILDSGSKAVILHKEESSNIDFTIIYNTLQKDTSNSEKEAIEHIYRQLRNAEPPDC
jgi:DNA-directed RNA polymerase subunit beta